VHSKNSHPVLAPCPQASPCQIHHGITHNSPRVPLRCSEPGHSRCSRSVTEVRRIHRLWFPGSGHRGGICGVLVTWTCDGLHRRTKRPFRVFRAVDRVGFCVGSSRVSRAGPPWVHQPISFRVFLGFPARYTVGISQPEVNAGPRLRVSVGSLIVS
jgi:hypothetical protein